MYSDYKGPALHETVTARGRQYPSTEQVPLRETRKYGMMAIKTAPADRKREKSVEVYAQPLSSTDEEEEEEDEKPAEPTPRSKRILARLEQEDEKIKQKQKSLEEDNAAPKAQQGKSTGWATQSGRKKLVDDPATDISFITDGQDQGTDVDEFFSMYEPARKKRNTHKYHSSALSNIHTRDANTKRDIGFLPIPDTPSPSRPSRNARAKFQAPDELKSPGPTGNRITSFKVPSEHDLPARRSTRSRIKDQEPFFKSPDDISSPRSATANSPKFKLPPDSTTSSATTTHQAPTVFSHPDSPPLTRSHSASSLSSIDSIASLLLTQDEKNDLMKNDHQATSTVNSSTATPTTTTHKTAQCPLCLTPISAVSLEEFTIRHHRPTHKSKSTTTPRLPTRLQQQFCRQHRHTSALETWHSRSYPTINWDALSTSRITTHLPHIRSLLLSPSSHASHYRAKLVEGMQGGRRNLLKYLKEGVLDVVKFGYYGPRGGKVAAEAIMMRLSGELVQAARGDRVLREAGAGAYVQAVLVPELVGRWVGEDMGLLRNGKGEEEVVVRKVLEESSEIGRLVNEDEDRVVVVVPEEG